jgi:signal transduction histidine kinase
VRARLHRSIFLWFGVSILVTGVTVLLAFGLSAGREGSSWQQDLARARAFLGDRFALVWEDPVARDELARSVASQLDAFVELEDADHRPLGAFGAHTHPCHGCEYVVPVVRAGRGEVLGLVKLHAHRKQHSKWPFFVMMLVAGIMLWATSGMVARRIVRPLVEVERVAREIGDGKLSSRVRLGPHQSGEVGVVGDAINDMAARIEAQMAAQRELLAAVSHEMRTPMGHLRLLVELARDEADNPDLFDQMDRELIEADALIGELLASSQLEFAEIDSTSLDAGEVALRAIQRAGLTEDLLSPVEGDPSFEGDPTLLARALANLLDNAHKHGGGATAVEVSLDTGLVRFSVTDDGPGFQGADPASVFEPFSTGQSVRGRADGHVSLGLGLALVKRIALAHGGRAGAEDSPVGGARVWFEVARRSS